MSRRLPAHPPPLLAGLNAVVAFTKGHSVCGVFLQPQTLQAVTMDEAADPEHVNLFRTLIANLM